MATSSITLTELGTRIKQVLTRAFSENYWVVAEIAEIRENRNGHCYLELIEKDTASQQITARMKATIWSYTYRILKPYFETTTRQQLMAGLKILIQVLVEYQEVYGLSLNIRDIDPSFTVGDMEVRRRQIIAQLQSEGVLEMNKELELGEVIQRIAIISSPSAAGYEDFIKQLDNNPDNVRYYHKLFPAIMQGEKTEASIISALEKIFEYETLFDVVVIIRGGGATADLISFDAYDLALNVAQFPLPVLTGIGHERDFTVTDLVAHTHLKTPTAVASFIISHNQLFISRLQENHALLVELFDEWMDTNNDRLNKAANRLVPIVQQHIHQQKSRLNRIADKTLYLGRTSINHQKQKLGKSFDKMEGAATKRTRQEALTVNYLEQKLKTSLYQRLKNCHSQLTFLEESARLHDPVQLLNRGYSITTVNGMVIKSIEQITDNMMITTHLKDGEFTSRVEKP